MKTLIIAAALLAAPTVASAQVAAGSIPNTFDRPAGAAPAAPPPTTAPTRSQTPAHAGSEEALRDFIAAVQSDALDYAIFTDDLSAKVREQAPTITPLIKGFGAVQAVDFIGADGETDLYVVTFASAETEWMIGFRDEKIAALLFRPRQAE